MLALAGVVAAGCKADSPGDGSDGAGLDGGVNPDAQILDAGLVDCPDPPDDAHVCVRGHLYDFETDTPMGTGGPSVQIAVAASGEYERYRTDPTVPQGQIQPDGRFHTWVDGVRGGACFVLGSDVAGVHAGRSTVTCYGPSVRAFPDQYYRVYLLRESTLTAWAGSYPGTVDITMHRPVALGLCREADYSIVAPQQYDWFWVDIQNLANAIENYPLLDDRLGFDSSGNPLDFRMGTLPPSGAVISPMDLTSPHPPGVAPDFQCERNRFLGPHAFMDTADVAAGEIGLVFLVNLPSP